MAERDDEIGRFGQLRKRRVSIEGRPKIAENRRVIFFY